MIDFSKKRKGESATEVLPLPMGSKLKQRYRRIQNDFDKNNLDSLHAWTREEIEKLLDKAEQFLASKVQRPAS